MIYRGFKYSTGSQVEWDNDRKRFFTIRRGWHATKRTGSGKQLYCAFGITKHEAAQNLIKNLRALGKI